MDTNTRDPAPTPPATASVRRLLLSYIPVAAVFVALALFVALVPSMPSGPTTGITTFDGSEGRFGNDPAAGATELGDQGNADGISGSDGRASRGRTGSASALSHIDSIGDVFGQGPPGFDCSRNELFQGPTCRPPAFSGDNGGRTYRGVTRDTIKIVMYIPRRNEQVDAILAAAGAASIEERIDAGEAYTTAFNEHFELYGRKLEFHGQVGPNQANDPQGQIADAQFVANELDAFLVITATATEPFYTELARLGVPSFNLTDQYPQTYLQQHAPFVWSVLPDLDVTLDHVAEYWCKRVAGKPARWAGSPTLQNTRKLGLLHSDNSDAGPRLRDKINARCNGFGADWPVIEYASDIAQASQSATNAIAQLRAAGVNIVACLCDPIAPVFFTSEATKQGYFPEWMQTGMFVTDAPGAGRLYDQTQWGRSWGISVLSPYRLLREQARWHVYYEGGGDDCRVASGASSNYYQQFLYGVGAMEAAGPNLTVERWARAMFAMPVRGGSGTENRYSFGPRGPGPFTQVDNAMEHWWEPEARGPDGKPGYSFFVQAGLRHDLGKWPAGNPNMFVHDGSEQVRSDPDAC